MKSRIPFVDPLQRLLGYHLRRASAVIMADLAAALAPLELRVTEASVLFVVDANPGSTASRIGRTLGIKRANMTPLIGALVGKGLVELDRMEGRSQPLRLTRRGKRVCREARHAADDHENRFFASLRPEERRAVIAVLRNVWDRSAADR